jgi:hypothetical protein
MLVVFVCQSLDAGQPWEEACSQQASKREGIITGRGVEV